MLVVGELRNAVKKRTLLYPNSRKKREWHAVPKQSHQARQYLSAHIINDATL
jgi:hypothetical protein